ncbi:aldehyde dehydrogenase family protein, partial [Acidovorax sp.]|uniref:aldehyde dehydrogenase family protein n=1 Tax=Acidovorax sp. TaxID=1872122 RepID=UPI00391C588F
MNGAVEAVNALCDHPDILAVSFVGSSRVAEIVAKRCRALNKRVLALGGAKNHLVALPDCDVELTASDVVTSFAGCAGQRCMAASVLLVVGENQALLDAVVAKTSALTMGTGNGQVGPVIDAASKVRFACVTSGWHALPPKRHTRLLPCRRASCDTLTRRRRLARVCLWMAALRPRRRRAALGWGP